MAPALRRRRVSQVAFAVDEDGTGDVLAEPGLRGRHRAFQGFPGGQMNGDRRGQRAARAARAGGRRRGRSRSTLSPAAETRTSVASASRWPPLTSTAGDTELVERAGGAARPSFGVRTGRSSSQAASARLGVSKVDRRARRQSTLAISVVERAPTRRAQNGIVDNWSRERAQAAFHGAGDGRGGHHPDLHGQRLAGFERARKRRAHPLGIAGLDRERTLGGFFRCPAMRPVGQSPPVLARLEDASLLGPGGAD